MKNTTQVALHGGLIHAIETLPSDDDMGIAVCGFRFWFQSIDKKPYTHRPATCLRCVGGKRHRSDRA